MSKLNTDPRPSHGHTRIYHFQSDIWMSRLWHSFDEISIWSFCFCKNLGYLSFYYLVLHILSCFMYSCICVCVCVCISSIICKNLFSMCGILYFYLLNCISQLCTKGHQLYITQKALEAIFPNRGAVLTLRGILPSCQACWLQLLFVLVWGRELFCTSEDI